MLVDGRCFITGDVYRLRLLFDSLFSLGVSSLRALLSPLTVHGVLVCQWAIFKLKAPYPAPLITAICLNVSFHMKHK